MCVGQDVRMCVCIVCVCVCVTALSLNTLSQQQQQKVRSYATQVIASSQAAQHRAAYSLLPLGFFALLIDQPQFHLNSFQLNLHIV